MLQKTDVTGRVYSTEHHLASGVKPTYSGWADKLSNLSHSSPKTHVTQYREAHSAHHQSVPRPHHTQQQVAKQRALPLSRH